MIGRRVGRPRRRAAAVRAPAPQSCAGAPALPCGASPRRRLLEAGCGVALAVALAACAGPSGPGTAWPVFGGTEPARGFSLPVEKPVVHVGDRWIWSGHETGDTASDDVKIVERVVVQVNGDRVELRQTALHPVTHRPIGAPQKRMANLATWHLEPGVRATGEIRALQFPLTIGKQWDYEYWLGGGDRDVTTTYRYHARVDGIETVRTPAGRFETLRVTHEGRWSRAVLEQGRPAQRSGNVTTTYWYAPAVGTWVRLEIDLRRPDGSREIGIVQELVGYDPAR